MFQLIATSLTVAALLWATALKPAHAAFTVSTTSFAQPVAGASLIANTTQLPEGFEFADVSR
jgi:hypothetical protein